MQSIGVLDTCYLCCDWGQTEWTLIRQKRKHNGSHTNNYFFFLVAKFIDGSWLIRNIRNPNHNYQPTIAASHPSLRELKLTPAIASKIKRVTQVNPKLAVIIDSLCLAQGKDFDNNEPTYKTKDIYNMKAKLQQRNLGILSLIQALMQKLNSSSWYEFSLIVVYF